MSNENQTFQSVLDEMTAAAAELRTVARSEHDDRRARAMGWLDELFAGVTNGDSHHKAAAKRWRGRRAHGWC